MYQDKPAKLNSDPWDSTHQLQGLSQAGGPGGHIMPTTLLRAPPRIFRPCDGPKYGLIDSINTVMNNPIFFVLFDHAIKK